MRFIKVSPKSCPSFVGLNSCVQIPKACGTGWYPYWRRLLIKFSKARIAACFNPYIPFFNFYIDIVVVCFEFVDAILLFDVVREMLVVYFHVFTASHWCGQKKSFKSSPMNLAPLCASEITLFSMILVSSREAAGDPGSSS